jgi:hypothetical protein
MNVFLCLIAPSVGRTYQNMFFVSFQCVFRTLHLLLGLVSCVAEARPLLPGSGPGPSENQLIFKSVVFVTGTRRIAPPPPHPTHKRIFLLVKSLCSPHKRGRGLQPVLQTSIIFIRIRILTFVLLI